MTDQDVGNAVLMLIFWCFAPLIVWLLMHRRKNHPKQKPSNDIEAIEYKHGPTTHSNTEDRGSGTIKYSQVINSQSKTYAAITDKPKIAEIGMANWLEYLGPEYVIFNNLIVPCGAYGDTTEIDHVVVSKYGLFCIETKSHHGNIYGFKGTPKWRQYIGNEVHEFQNPLRQNFKHTEALRILLHGHLKTNVHNYVVFPNAHLLKCDTKMATTKYQDIIKAILAHQVTNYSLTDLKEILRILSIYSSMYSKLNPIHVDNVKHHQKTR